MSDGHTPGATIARLVATLFGAGRSPLVPGTVGTLAALPLVLLAGRLLPPHGYLAATVAVTAVGVWAAGRLARDLGRHDPGEVVVDEAAGLFVTLAYLPSDPGTVALGFVLFRIMDIWKPPPAARAEHLPGGFGIVADDLIAGAYANLALRALRLVYRSVAG